MPVFSDHQKVFPAGKISCVIAIILLGGKLSGSCGAAIAAESDTNLAINEMQNPNGLDPDAIKQNVATIYGQSQPATSGLVNNAASTATPLPSTALAAKAAQEDAEIKERMSRLMNEKLYPTVTQPVSTAPSSPSTPIAPMFPTGPAVINTAPVDALPSATTPVLSQQAQTPTAIGTAHPVDTTALVSTDIPAMAPGVPPPKATPSPQIPASSVIPGQPVLPSTLPPLPLASSSTKSQTIETPKISAPLPVATATPTIAAIRPSSAAPAAVASQIAAFNATPTDTASGALDSVFLKNLIGADGVALNVSDVSSPADIQAPLHIDEAVAFALKNNFEVQAANEKSRGAFWDKMGGYSEYLPAVELDADTGPERSDPASFNDAFGNRVMDNTHNRRDHSISIRQPLIDLGAVSDIISGQDKEKIATSDRIDVREGIAFDTVSTYLGLLQARIAVRLADDYKQYLDNLAARMKSRVEGGGAASSDLDRIRGRATSAESARIEALGEYETNLAELKRLTRVTPAQLVIPEMLAPAIPDSMQGALENALKYNPSYLSSLQKVDVAADDRNKSFSGLLPKLSAEYTNTYSFNAGGAAEGNPVDGVYPVQKTQTVMLVAQWELNGGTAVAGGLSGAAKEREMNLRALDVRARLEQGIRSGYTAINAAHQRQAALRKAVEANERVVKGFEEQYTNGTRSLFDVLDSYEQLYNSRLNLMRVTIANAKASYQIHRQMGQLVPTIIRTEDK